MTWAALSDDLIARMQHDELSRDDQLLYVEGLVYAARLLTDGELPSDLRAFTTHPQAAEAALRLVWLDYWRISGKGYEITNYLKVNRSAEQVERSKERNRIRQHRARLHREGDHSLCVPSYCPKAPNAVTHAVSHRVSHDALSSPLLKRGERNSEPGRQADGLAPVPLESEVPAPEIEPEPEPRTLSPREGAALVRQALTTRSKK